MNQAWGRRTRLIHGGSRRSDFGETSEALFLTSGFRYLRAEDAADRFADRAPGYMYSRVANPTVRMFEERLALLEGAEEAAATATGMAAVHAALMSQLRAGNRVVGTNVVGSGLEVVQCDVAADCDYSFRAASGTITVIAPGYKAAMATIEPREDECGNSVAQRIDVTLQPEDASHQSKAVNVVTGEGCGP